MGWINVGFSNRERGRDDGSLCACGIRFYGARQVYTGLCEACFEKLHADKNIRDALEAKKTCSVYGKEGHGAIHPYGKQNILVCPQDSNW